MLKKLVYKDKQTRNKYKKLEHYSLLNKSLKKNLEVYGISKNVFTSTKRATKTSKVQIRNRCIFSGRGNGLVSKFRMSRMFFIKNAGKGLLAGVYKSN